MRQGMLVLFFALSLFASSTYAQTPKEPPATAEFELRIGNSKHDVAEGKPFSIVTPKGERVELILSRKKVLQYAGNGISFNYDSAMTIEVEKDLGVVTVTVNSTASPMAMIQIYSAPLTPDEVRNQLIQSLQQEFKTRGAEFLQDSGKTIKRKIRDTEREGQYLRLLLGGEQMKMEIFAFQKGSNIMCVMLQHLESDAELAKRYFSLITDSLQ